MAAKILVLGIGNTLLSDEGVGVHVVNYIAAHYPAMPDVQLLDGGTLSFTLAESIAQADGLIVVDAARLDQPPGTMQRFEADAMDHFLQGNCSSVHEVGLTDLLDMTRLTDDLPQWRCLIGIQPGYLEWGEHPTPEVQTAIPIAAQQILEIIADWGGCGQTAAAR